MAKILISNHYASQKKSITTPADASNLKMGIFCLFIVIMAISVPHILLLFRSSSSSEPSRLAVEPPVVPAQCPPVGVFARDLAEKLTMIQMPLAMCAESYFPNLAKHAQEGIFILNTPIVYREIMNIFIINFANDPDSWCDPLINNICRKIVEYLHNRFVNESTFCYVFIDTLTKQKPITIKYLFCIKLINIIEWSYEYNKINNNFMPIIPDMWKPEIDQLCVSKQSFLDFQYKCTIEYDRKNNDTMSYMYIQNTIYGQIKELIKNNPDLNENHYRSLRDVFCRYSNELI